MTCKDCIHENICVIIAFPEAFENTKWEKEHCDHFKNKADYAEVKHEQWIKADLLLQKLYNLRNSLMANNSYVDGFKCAISSIEGIVGELTNCGALMDGNNLSELLTGSEGRG